MQLALPKPYLLDSRSQVLDVKLTRFQGVVMPD